MVGEGVSAERKEPTERDSYGVLPGKKRVLWRRTPTARDMNVKLFSLQWYDARGLKRLTARTDSVTGMLFCFAIHLREWTVS